MINPVILKDTQKSEWTTIRKKIYSRIKDGIGGIPKEEKVQFTETARYQKYGLTFVEISYLVYNNTFANALIILPEDFDPTSSYPAVVTIHGTNDLGAGIHAVKHRLGGVILTESKSFHACFPPFLRASEKSFMRASSAESTV